MKFLASLLDALIGKPFAIRDEPDMSPVEETAALLRSVDPYIGSMREQVEVHGASDWVKIDVSGLQEVRLVKYGPAAAMMTGTALECRTMRGTHFDHLCFSWFDLLRNYSNNLGTVDEGPNPLDFKGSTASMLGLFPQSEAQENMSYREAKAGQLISKPTGVITWLFIYDCSVA